MHTSKVKYDTSPLKLNSKFIIPLAMLFVASSTAAAVVSYKFSTMGPLIECGATIIFPLTYLISDVITEVYGYAIARNIIWYALGCELVFALAIELVLALPNAAGFPYQNEYKVVLSPVLWFVVSGIIGDLVSSFTNIYLLSKLKILLKGKKFIVRSILSTAVGELIMNIIVCGLAFSSVVPLITVSKIIFHAYLLELIYAVIFVIPAAFLIIVLKRHDNKDAYDYGTNYNVFKIS